MILLSFFLFYTIIEFVRKHKLAAFMSLLIVIQVIFAFVINQVLEFTATNLLIELWHTLILYILIKPFEYYNFKEIRACNPEKIERFSKGLAFINLICLIISSIVVVMVWSVVDNYDSFKGQPDYIVEFLNDLPVSSKFLTLAYIFGSSYFFALGMHFYYLLKGKGLLSLVFLILSLSFPVRMLIYFSRSNLILLLLMYAVYSILVYPVLSINAKKAYKVGAYVIGGAIIVVAGIISINKFGEVDSKSSIFDKEGTLYQLVNYPSMWYQNMEVMEGYDLNPQGGELSDVLFDYWRLSKGPTNREVRMKLWPHHYYKFVPLPTVLTFDIGIILTFILSCLISLIVYQMRPRRGVISLPSFLFIGVMSSIVLMNFEGSMFEELYFHYALIFMVLIYMYFKTSIKHQRA